MQDFHSTVKPPKSLSTKIERSSYPLSTSPERNIMTHDAEMQVKSESFAIKTSAAADATVQPQTEQSTALGFRSGAAVVGPLKRIPLPKRLSVATLETPSSISLPPSPSQTVLMDGSAPMLIKSLSPPKKSPLITAAVASTSPQPTTISEGDASKIIVATKSPKSPEQPVSAEIASSRTQSTAGNDGIARNTTSETDLPEKAPVSMHLPASSLSTTVPASSSDTSTRGTDDEAEECQALLQSSSDDLDVIPSHDIQPSLQDSIVVRHKAQINLDTPVASSSALASISATTEILDEQINVYPPIPEVPTRRSSLRSSRSSTSEGLGTIFDDDFGPIDSVPATRTPTPEDQEPSNPVSPGSPKTYGGFRALTWKHFRKDLNNFIPKCYYAQDLPHALQDHINSMSEYTQRMDGMRQLFEATILENTVEDEPDAPPIEIRNSVDTQSTPPWEFYYTNHMWLGEGVPPPDIKNLVSCTCKGGCNPKSKTCACLMRQREAASDPLLEFAYDKNGKLKIPGYPIFECNDLCGCSDECRNRVGFV